MKKINLIFMLILLICLSGCGFTYNKETFAKFRNPNAPLVCNYEVLVNVKNDPKDADYIASRRPTVIGETFVSKYWFWPWPPSIPYEREDFRELVCATGADAIEVFQGMGAPWYRYARIRLLKWTR